MRIGHITDFHLRHHLEGTSAVVARRSRQVPDLLREAVTRLGDAGVDLVAVTGDLVDHPHEAGDEALDAGTQDLKLVAELLAPLPCPWIALPGNHDHPALFDEVFGAPADVEIAGHRVVAFHDWDSDDPVSPPPEPSARVPHRSGGERARFDAVLADADPRPQIHLQHYVLTPSLNEGWPHTYADGEAMTRALAADGRARLALSGHYHPGTEAIRADGTRAGTGGAAAAAAHAGAPGPGGGPWFVTGPAFCQAPHPFLLHDLDDAGGLTVTRVDLRPDLA